MSIANALQANQEFEALDREFLEFLSLYDVEDEEILNIVLDEQPIKNNQSTPETAGEK